MFHSALPQSCWRRHALVTDLRGSIGISCVLRLPVGPGDLPGFVSSLCRVKRHSEVITGVEPGLQCGGLVSLGVGEVEQLIVSCVVTVCRHTDQYRLKASSIRVEDANDVRTVTESNQLEYVIARAKSVFWTRNGCGVESRRGLFKISCRSSIYRLMPMRRSRSWNRGSERNESKQGRMRTPGLKRSA